jgi:hypothetical protein
MKKSKVIVGRNGLWAQNHEDLNLANSIINNQQTTVQELSSIMNSIVALGKQ